jgi:hypothetical protein
MNPKKMGRHLPWNPGKRSAPKRLNFPGDLTFGAKSQQQHLPGVVRLEVGAVSAYEAYRFTEAEREVFARFAIHQRQVRAQIGEANLARLLAHPKGYAIFAMASDGNKPPTLADAQRLLPKAVFLPIERGQKGPHLTGWTLTTFKQTQSEGYQESLRRHPVTGVLLGSHSGGLCTIDCDTDPFLEAILVLNPRLAETLQTHGQSGGQLWAYFTGRRPYKVVGITVSADSPLAKGARSEPDDNGRVEIGEFRAEGGQSVIAGPHKETGSPYTWPVANPPIEIPFDEIIWPADVATPWEEKRKITTDLPDPSLLKRAIAKLTVDDLWDHFGYGEHEKNPVTSPWYPEDVDTSFSIYDEGRRFKDHDPGRPNDRGDSFDFYCRAKGKTPKEAFEQFVKLAGLGDELRKNKTAQQEPERDPRKLRGTSIIDYAERQIDDSKTLLGNRWLSRQWCVYRCSERSR